MDSNQELFDKFDSEFYIKRLCEDDTSKAACACVSDWMHEIFVKGDIKGENLLDIGTGPNVSSAIYASSHFNKIYLSDYSRNNRKFLEEWYRGSHKELVKPFFADAVKRGGYAQTPSEKETELISKIEGVLYCDMRQENPLSGNQQHVPRQFDAVTMRWCLSNAAHTIAEYEQVLRNICSLIKPGGFLVDMGILDKTRKYTVNDATYLSAYFDADQTKKFFDTNSMKLVSWEYNDQLMLNSPLYKAVAKIV